MITLKWWGSLVAGTPKPSVGCFTAVVVLFIGVFAILIASVFWCLVVLSYVARFQLDAYQLGKLFASKPFFKVDAVSHCN